jgi:hypothetical protein
MPCSVRPSRPASARPSTAGTRNRSQLSAAAKPSVLFVCARDSDKTTGSPPAVADVSIPTRTSGRSGGAAGGEVPGGRGVGRDVLHAGRQRASGFDVGPFESQRQLLCPRLPVHLSSVDRVVLVTRRGDVEACANAAHPHPCHTQRQRDQSQHPVSTAPRVAVPDPGHESFVRVRAINAIVANRCSVHGWTAAG